MASGIVRDSIASTGAGRCEVFARWVSLCRLERGAIVCFQQLSGNSNRRALRLEIINWVATGSVARVKDGAERNRREILRPVNGPLDDGRFSNAREPKAHRPTPACATVRGDGLLTHCREGWASLRSQNWLPHVRGVVRKGAFSVSIRNGSGVCFVWVTAISNRIECRLEIVFSAGSRVEAAVRARVIMMLLAPARLGDHILPEGYVVVNQ
jgi:hypothetical protein